MDNLQQRMDVQIAKETVRAEAEETVRKMVDAMMVIELDRLRAIDREPAPRPSKKDKKKKEKKGATKRGKKDPFGGRTVEELYSELVIAGIVSKPLQVTLDDLIGAPNYTDTRRNVYRLATPHDLKMALREMFGIPLCSRLIHSTVEQRKSVLLAGPPGVGKTLMVNGLCKETGANLFDLSPVKMVGLYQGRKQEDYLMNLLFKVAKAMEPTIILVNECHLLFPTKKAKKRSDVDKDKPSRWVRMLSRLMKMIVQGDRILLVGVTNEPFFAKTTAMCKLFENVFLVPFPEYGTRYALWQHHIKNLKLTRPHNMDLSIMAKMSEGYTGHDIEKIIANVCTPARQGLKRRLRNAEMLQGLTDKYPDDEAPSLADWITWYLTTPMMVARKQLIDGILEEEEAAAAAAKPAKRK
ncbi:IQ and AAA domain-containing protein 1-like [Elysia marginata]|uniref:IQ and AAA domain-containing protein 1-like n=1 Tax=Elysia marginata TaxID=1093978 RepID=A0AAV4G0N7_9GAST|nr:IQ and AAA domain-containing protein 1-like [Elysia marginata]